MRLDLLIASCCCLSWCLFTPAAQADPQRFSASKNQLPDGSEFYKHRQKWQVVNENPDITNTIHAKNDVVYEIEIPPTKDTTTVIRMKAPSDSGGSPGVIRRGAHELPVSGFGGPSNIPSQPLYGPGSLPDGNVKNHVGVGLEGKMNPVILNKPGELIRHSMSGQQPRVEQYDPVPMVSGQNDRKTEEHLRGWMLAPEKQQVAPAQH
jgi:hypothetical protein